MILLGDMVNEAHALGYVGPGAGMGLVYSFLLVLTLAASTGLIVLLLPATAVASIVRGLIRPKSKRRYRRVVILGIDGLDPTVLNELVQRGQAPNFAALAARGCLRPLRTTTPPISPSAWSSMVTGVDASRHGIYDFIRPTATYGLELSSCEIVPPPRVQRIGRYCLPLSSCVPRSRRKGRSLWQALGRGGIESVVLRVPASFPPEPIRGQMLSGMCVPDLVGSQGTYSRYSTRDVGDAEGGGQFHRLEFRDGVAESEIVGPAHPLRCDGAPIRLPIRLRRRDTSVSVEWTGTRIDLAVGAMTPWHRVSFRAGFFRLHGLSQFYLRSCQPEVEMYVSPLHLDPETPAMPISHPRVFGDYLARRCGPYGTLGLAEDMAAMNDRAIDTAGFLAQAWGLLEERRRMFRVALAGPAEVVCCVFDTPDRISHMFWREHEEARGVGARPAEDPVSQVYQRMDEVLGETLASIGRDDLLLVISDHGFAPFQRAVNLNAWLEQQGYLCLLPGSVSQATHGLGDVDWSRTRAFGVGLASLFINRAGRFRQGIVGPEKAAALCHEIKGKLERLEGPDGGRVVREAFVTAEHFAGPFRNDGPDLIVGYERGYRCDARGAAGEFGRDIVIENRRQWSGDHCMHADVVPGVLAANVPLGDGEANMIDIAPTVLDAMGLSPASTMQGKSLLERP